MYGQEAHTTAQTGYANRSHNCSGKEQGAIQVLSYYYLPRRGTMKRSGWGFSLLIVTMALSIAFTSACAGANMTLIFGSAGDASRLDPADVTDGESIQRMDNIFEGLVEYKPGSTEIQPALAESWEISDSGLEFTFHLRRGVKFHDGTTFDAYAVEFSFARQYDPDNPFHQFGEWAYWGWMFDYVDHVEVVGPYTVKVYLSEPNASFMTSLAMFTVAIVSPYSATLHGADSFKHPVGTGPFKFVEWVKDDHITLARFEDYWRDPAKLDQVIFRVIPDPSARLIALEKGEIDGMEYPDPDQLQRIKNNPNLQLLSAPGMNVGYLAMNMGEDTPGYQEPFGDVRVRRAVNHAINRQEIVTYLYQGTAVVAKNPIPPVMWGYNDSIQDYEYDPGKARDLLAEAGYPNGFETTLWAMPVSRPYMFDPQKIAEAIQSYLLDVGIDADIFQEDWGTYLQDTEAGKHPMCLLGWSGDNGDPDNFIYVLLDKDATTVGSAGNVAFYRSDELHDINIAARQTYDFEQRVSLYEQAQQIIHRDAPWVPIAHSTQVIAFKHNVHGYVLHPTTRKFFQPVWIEE